MEMENLNLDLLMGPLVGAVIGYITNGIAIKMLFRPLKPIYIGKWKLPFTPGLIPKERGRIAKTVGQVVSRELINEEVLTKALLKEEIYKGIEQRVDEFIKTNEDNEETFEVLANRIIGNERTVYLACEGEELATTLIYNKVVELELGKKIVDKLINAFKEGKLSAGLGPLSFLINGNMMENLGSKLEPVITQMIVEEGEQMIRQAIEVESEKLRNMPISEVALQVKERNEFIKKLLVKAYQYIVSKKLAHALEVVNIAKMVEERIHTYDPLEIEKIILSIMDKELRAIVWLGALLGAIMGCIMSFV